MRGGSGGRRATASTELRAAREALRREGGRFREPRPWLARYVWQAHEPGWERPLRGPGTAVVRAVDERQVWDKLRAGLPQRLALVEVVFAEPWGDAGSLVLP